MAAVVTLSLLTAIVLVPLGPGQARSAAGGDWSRQSAAFAQLRDQGAAVSVATASPLQWDGDPTRTTMLILEPQWSYASHEVDWLHQLARDGAHLVIAADTGAVDSLLRPLGVGLDPAPVYQSAPIGAPEVVPAIWNDGLLTLSLTLNGARSVVPEDGGDVLLRGAEGVWVDADDDEVRDLDEYGPGPALGMRLSLGSGWVTVLGDGGIFGEPSLRQPDHAALLEAVADRPLVVLDLSHRDPGDAAPRAHQRIEGSLTLLRTQPWAVLVVGAVASAPILLWLYRRPEPQEWGHRDRLGSWGLRSVRPGPWTAGDRDELRQAVLEAVALAGHLSADEAAALTPQTLAGVVDDATVRDLLTGDRTVPATELHVVAHWIAKWEPPELASAPPGADVPKSGAQGQPPPPDAGVPPP